MTSPSLHSTFISYQSKFKDLLLDSIAEFSLPQSVQSRISSLFDYTVLGGKMNRGTLVLQTGCILSSSTTLPAPIEESLCYAGWCIELMQAFFLVADDVMDGSTVRRGKPCWHRIPSVGMQAVNDAVLLESLMFRIISKVFGCHCKHQIIDAFHTVTLQTELGQVLDLTLDALDFVNVRRGDYERMVTYKTAFYSFVLPVQLALGIVRGEWCLSPVLTAALIKLGVMFQMQDDLLDCYGAVDVIGKVGTDIEDGKYSMLLVVAVEQLLKRCESGGGNDELQILTDNYAHAEKECVEKVKGVFERCEVKEICESELGKICADVKMFQGAAEWENEIVSAVLNCIDKRKC